MAAPPCKHVVPIVDTSITERGDVCFFSSASQTRSFCNIIMVKTEHCTFIFLLWVDFKTAEPVVGQETSELLDGYSFPGQIHRVGALPRNGEVLRLCEWNWKKGNAFKKNELNMAHSPVCLTVWTVCGSLYLLLIFMSLFCFVKLIHIYIKWWVNHRVKTLTSLFVVKNTHFICPRSPTRTSMFEVEIVSVILHRYNRKSKTLIYFLSPTYWWTGKNYWTTYFHLCIFSLLNC